MRFPPTGFAHRPDRMRIDKFIGNNSELSRSQIHGAIKQGLVKRNGLPVTKANELVAQNDQISFDGNIIVEKRVRYLMLHKPSGYVCANTDSEHPTVLDLIDLPFKSSLQIVGRLDIDTTGLVLLTDDGNWNHKITSPRHSHSKTYLVTTADDIDASAVAMFAEGILLKGETKATRPAQLIITGTHSAELKLCEGKYHQVKRMFAALGNRVVGLHRSRIGNITLDEKLAPGTYRALTADEINSLETHND